MKSSNIPFRPFRVNRSHWQARGLLAWWPALFSRGCNVWYDLVNGINLNNSGGVGDVSADMLGWTKNWSSDDIYAAAVGAPLLTAVGTQLTIAAWARIAAGSTGNRHIFSVTTNSSAAIAYQILRSNTGLWFYVGATSQATGLIFSDTAWKHIVCRYDGQNLRSYVNGVEVGTPVAYSSAVSTGSENIPAIGAKTSAANYWRGDIADVRVYGRILSAAEIWQLYAPETRWDLYDTGYNRPAGRFIAATPNELSWQVLADCEQDLSFSSDLSPYVLSASWRNGCSAPFADVSQPSNATIELDNVNGLFTPETSGSDLVTNGDFADWTTDDPDGWTVTGESASDPEVSEVGSGESHGGTGTGMCNLYTTSAVLSISQDILTVGTAYRLTFTINTEGSVGGFLAIKTGTTEVSRFRYHMTGTKTVYFVATDTVLKIETVGAVDITIDDVVCQETNYYNGRLTRGVQVRIKAIYNNAYVLYQGKVANIQYTPGSHRQRTVTVQLNDLMLDFLDKEYLPRFEQDITTDVALQRVFDQAVIPYPYGHTYGLLDAEGCCELNGNVFLYNHDSYTFETGITNLNYVGDNNETAGTLRIQTYLRDIVAAECGGKFWFNARDNQFTFLNRHHTALFTTPSITLTASDIESATYNEGLIWNTISVEYQPRSVGAAHTVLWSATNTPFRLSPGQTRNINAKFRDPDNTAQRIGAAAVDPTKSGVDYVANEKEDGSGQNVTQYIGIGMESGGQAAKLNLTNQHPNEVYITTLQVRGTPIYLYPQETADGVDPDSVREYNTCPMIKNVRMLDDSEIAQDYSNALLNTYNQSKAYVSDVTFITGETDATKLGYALDHTIGDLISISESWLGHAQNYLIVGEQWQIMVGGENPVTVRWITEPVIQQIKCLLDTVGYGELDSTAILMF